VFKILSIRTVWQISIFKTINIIVQLPFSGCVQHLIQVLVSVLNVGFFVTENMSLQHYHISTP